MARAGAPDAPGLLRPTSPQGQTHGAGTQRRAVGFRRLFQPMRRRVRRLFIPEDHYMDPDSLFARSPGTSATAEFRAMQLLLRVLRSQQRTEFLHTGHFTVEAPGWGHFQIYPRLVFNVVSEESGLAYCAVPDIAVPIPDLMLSQKLLLENDPVRFFRVANHRRHERNRASDMP